MQMLRKRLTYANVMSSIAVFLVLGGATAFAATKIGANEIKANSIKTGKIVKEAVTAGKIKKGAVTESRIADGAVTANKLGANSVTTTKIADKAVTGAKLDLANLGTVPASANATNLGGKGPASYESKATEVGTNENVPLNANGTTVIQTLDLAAGTYVLLARGTVNNNGAANSSTTCALNAGTNLREVRAFNLAATGTPGEREDFSVQLVNTFTAPGAATLTCNTAAFTGNVITPALTAISVQP